MTVPIAEKLRKLADAMQPQIDQKLHGFAGQNWTARRARLSQGMFEEGQELLRIQRVLYRLADLHDAGEVPDFLVGVQTRKAVEAILVLRDFPSTDWVVEAYQGMLTKANISTSSWPTVKAAIEELAGEEDKAAVERRKLADKVRGMVGVIPGFYPTPPEVVDRMLDQVSVEINQALSMGLTVRILEPSAGSGAIVQRILERWKGWPDGLVKVECVEINYDLRDHLARQGYLLVGDDFMEFQPPPGREFDYAIMNPPFEDGQDMRHIMHAHDCLFPGGKVVSVISEGPFFRQDRASVDFRAWLEENGGYDITLPPGSFNHSGTGVSARIVVVPKAAGEPEPEPEPKPEPKPQAASVAAAQDFGSPAADNWAQPMLFDL